MSISKMEYVEYVVQTVLSLVIQSLVLLTSPLLFLKSWYNQPKRKKFSKILITGGSSGVGKALALEFAKQGATVHITGRNERRLSTRAPQTTNQECRSLGAKAANWHKVDVTDREGMNTLVFSLGAMDLVIANAGKVELKSDDRNEIYNLFEVNVMGVLNTIMPAIPLMEEQGGGHIAVTSSLTAFVTTEPMRGDLYLNAGYPATKICEAYLLEDMRTSLAAQNIGTTTLCPSVIPNSILNKMSIKGFEQMMNISVKLGFVMDPDAATKHFIDAMERNVIRATCFDGATTIMKLWGCLQPWIFEMLEYNGVMRGYISGYMSQGESKEKDS